MCLNEVLLMLVFLVGILLDKFLYHLPLYRQHQRLEQNGVQVARSTLTNLVKCSIEHLMPIYQTQIQSILLSRVLTMDETPIKAGRKKQGKMNKAYFWPIYGDQNEVCFTFSLSRGMQHILDQPGDFSGVLATDGYGAYEQINKQNSELSHAQRWVHSRRYFDDAQKAEPEAAAMALAYIGRLYEHEKVIRTQALTGHAKQGYRYQNSKLVVDAFIHWCYEQRQRIDLVKSNPLSKALAYVMKREAALCVYLNDPEIPMDTTHLDGVLSKYTLNTYDEYEIIRIVLSLEP